MKMTIKQMCEFLMYRCVLSSMYVNLAEIDKRRVPVKTSGELLDALERFTRGACESGEAALALSGGIDLQFWLNSCPKDQRRIHSGV